MNEYARTYYDVYRVTHTRALTIRSLHTAGYGTREAAIAAADGLSANAPPNVHYEIEERTSK